MDAHAIPHYPGSRWRAWLIHYGPGMACAVLLGVLAWGLQVVETQGLGHTVLDALVLALLLGILWRHVLGVPACARPGLLFTGKYVLEVAVALLGTAIDLPALLRAGPRLLLAVVMAAVAPRGRGRRRHASEHYWQHARELPLAETHPPQQVKTCSRHGGGGLSTVISGINVPRSVRQIRASEVRDR